MKSSSSSSSFVGSGASELPLELEETVRFSEIYGIRRWNNEILLDVGRYICSFSFVTPKELSYLSIGSRVQDFARWNNKLIVSSSDGKVGIWDYPKEKKTCENSFSIKDDASERYLNHLAFWKNKLVASVSDFTIEIRNLPEGTLGNVLVGHEDTINAILIWNDKVISGSRDANIRIWNLNTFECEKIIKTLYVVDQLFLWNDNTLVSSSSAGMDIWNLSSGKLEKTLKGHGRKGYHSNITGIIRSNDLMLSCSKDCSIKVWDFATGVCLTTFDYKDPISNMMPFDDRLIVVWNTDYISILKPNGWF